MPAQRLRRWSSIVQMLYKCFLVNGNIHGFLYQSGSNQNPEVQPTKSTATDEEVVHFDAGAQSRIEEEEEEQVDT